MTAAASGPDSLEASDASASPGDSREPAARTVALVDLLDRVLAGGVVISGDITLSIEGVDLVHISLRALVTSVSAASLAESS